MPTHTVQTTPSAKRYLPAERIPRGSAARLGGEVASCDPGPHRQEQMKTMKGFKGAHHPMPLLTKHRKPTIAADPPKTFR